MRGGGGNSGSGSTNYTAEELASGACEQQQGEESGDCDAYVECAQEQCQSEYEMCLGSGYRSGNFSGAVCETFIECSISADDQCENDCPLDQACQNCFVSTLGSCVSSKCSAELSECSGGANTNVDLDGVGTATCADLEACCGSMSGSDASTCQMQLDAVSAGGDLGCSTVYSVYQISGMCP